MPKVQGSIDDKFLKAQFNTPKGICFDFEGNLLVADQMNYKIRKLNFATNTVESVKSNLGYQPFDVIADYRGNFYVANGTAAKVNKYSSQGLDFEIGSSSAHYFTDGNAIEAGFCLPASIAFNSDGNILVCDYGNHAIRLILNYPKGISVLQKDLTLLTHSKQELANHILKLPNKIQNLHTIICSARAPALLLL